MFSAFKATSTIKGQSLMVLAGAIGIGCLALSAKPSYSQLAAGQKGFYCDTSTGVPTTMYQNSNGGREPWIKWESNAFPDYDPLRRCQEVSARLETYRKNKQLKYITVGKMNNEQVICTASQVNGRCENLIYTLKPGQDAVATLNKLLAWREGQAGVPSLSENDPIPYIDVSGRIEYDSDAPTRNVAPIKTPQAVPQPPASNGGSREL